MPKNIIILSDGTGQEGGVGHNTNVYKLFNMLLSRSKEQVVFYDRGLGTGWRKVTGNVAGMGISKNILECYEFIFDNYEAGDDIFLFGFSRGAATVRSLSGFIHLFGILPHSRRELIKKAYGIYKIGDSKKREKEAKEFIEKHHTMWSRIKFLGVWDTVAALGLPIKPVSVVLDNVKFFQHTFHNFALSKSVENAYHALAIDDERLTFHPVLWDKEIEQYQTMKQVWFCGMHTDVGGGYPKQELSDIALDWMVKMASKHGVKIYPHHQVKFAPDPNGHMHDSRGKGWTKLFRKATRKWNTETHGKPVIHASVLQRTHNRDNRPNPDYKPWILDREYDVEPDAE